MFCWGCVQSDVVEPISLTSNILWTRNGSAITLIIKYLIKFSSASHPLFFSFFFGQSVCRFPRPCKCARPCKPACYRTCRQVALDPLDCFTSDTRQWHWNHSAVPSGSQMMIHSSTSALMTSSALRHVVIEERWYWQPGLTVCSSWSNPVYYYYNFYIHAQCIQ